MFDLYEKRVKEFKDFFLDVISPYIPDVHSYEITHNFCRLNEKREEKESVYITLILFENPANFENIEKKVNRFAAARGVEPFTWSVEERSRLLIAYKADITKLFETVIELKSIFACLDKKAQAKLDEKS